MRTSTEKFTQLARIGAEFLALPQEQATLNAIVTKATEFVPGCSSAAIVRTETHGVARVVASSGGLADEVAPLSLGLVDDPTTSCLTTGRTTVVRVAQEARWPVWAAQVRERGATGAVSLALVAGNDRLGVLVLYTSDVEGFDEDAVPMAAAYVSHASVALFAARQASGLSTAVEARHRIGIAQGILMCRYSISKEIAFQLLRRYSNASNTKLRDVAVQVYERGDLPPGVGRRGTGPAAPVPPQPDYRYHRPGDEAST